MYENVTFESILQRMLDRVSDQMDKRESSPIYNALAANKHQGIRLPIAFHESDEVAPVPGILLVGH